MLEHLIIGVAMILTAAVVIGCSKRSQPSDADLHASLLLHATASAGDHRTEAANRDAAHGFHRCSVCAFENFKRFPFCSLCGHALLETAAACGRDAPATVGATRVPVPLDSSTPKWSQVVETASLDFPAKYAHFVASTAALMAPVHSELLKVNVSRALLLEDSIESLAVIPQAYIRASMRINFVDERGLDAGGLQREWFLLMNERLADSSNGVLRCVHESDQALYLNPTSAHDIGDDHLLYFFATGRLIGRALLEGQVLSFHLALPLLKIVLGLPVTFSDLEYFDPELYKNLVWIRDNDGVDALGLDFSVTEQRGDGEMVTVDLVPGGRDMDVTDANKLEYLDRRFHYTLFESVSSQLYVFLKGVYEVIPQELLMLFDPEEFDYLLCGSDEIDVDDWLVNTKCSQSLRGSKALEWFWEIVHEMPNEYRRRLLHFATGSSRVPIAGFSALTSKDSQLCPFTLKLADASSKGHIASHACFNRLDIPLYASRAKLELVLYATLDTDLYGFTIA